MRTIEVPSDRFDSDGFVDALLNFYREEIGPDEEGDHVPNDYVAIFDEEDDEEEEDDDDEGGLSWLGEAVNKNQDPKRLLAKGETMLFCLPVECGPGASIRLVDGQVIEVPDRIDEEGNPSPDWDEKYESIPSDTDCYGFILAVKGGTARIESVLYDNGDCMGPGPAVFREQDCGILDEVMETFARKFIRE